VLQQFQYWLAEHFGNEIEKENMAVEPNFSVGLGHILSGINVAIKETRFHFSHKFSQI
jgi:hypothetical protein